MTTKSVTTCPQCGAPLTEIGQNSYQYVLYRRCPICLPHDDQVMPHGSNAVQFDVLGDPVRRGDRFLLTSVALLVLVVGWFWWTSPRHTDPKAMTVYGGER